MIQFQEVKINNIYLTSNDSASGFNYISEVKGLTPLKMQRRWISRNAITGTPRIQIRPQIGSAINVLIPLIPTAKYSTLITALDSAIMSGNDHSCVFTGMKGTFTLTCVLLQPPDDNGEMQDSGHRDFECVFGVKAVVSIV